ncbi:InlB B-repeat-containing protein [Agromyces sp. Root1464]|uniref:InlB B-repeat-containing protein n=1 Tax=Agromyces sp. Root1464 TaxID=1736467 RepID=UPI000B300FD0|nr:hypothetical protein [Agromyces sp. Root1464]
MSKPGAALAHADGDARTRVRWSSRRPFRRIAAILTSLALGAGIAVVGVAAPASAHTGDLKANAVCNTETGMYDVTYTLTLSNVPSGKTGTTMWRVGTTKFDGTPKSAKGMDRGPISTTGNKTITLGTEQLAGDTKSFGPWVYAYTTWNGATKGSDGQLKQQLAGDCGDETPVKKIEFCHATGSASNPYVRIETAVEAFYNAGHIDHKGDIWPAFSYKKHGKVISVPAQGDQSLLEYEDCVKPVVKIPVEGAPTFSDTCGPDNEKLTVPEDTARIDWNSSESDGVITVTATAKPGYEFKKGEKTTWTFTIDDKPCVVQVVGAPAFSDKCGADNEKLTVPEDTATIDWNSTEVDGVITVTATAKPGNVFPEGATKAWTFTIDDKPCVIELVGAPDFSDKCGVDNEKLTVPEDTATIDWNSTEVDGVITVTATAKPGNVFPEGATKAWTFTINDAPCIVDVVGEPTFSDKCGADNEKLTVPEDTDTIDWNSSEENGTITVTATAKAGSAFPVGAKDEWTFVVNDAPCAIELVGAPEFSDKCGPDNEKLTVPSDTDTIDWASADANGVWTVTATAKPGYAFEEGGPVTWAFPYSDKPCIAPTLTGSFATGVCEADSPWITFDVEMTDPDSQSTGNTASLVMTDGTNTETIVLGDLENGSLSGKVLWPGASVDADGKANGWPGWALVGDKWIEVDDNFAWTRGDITAQLVVNPELDVKISYPPATPNCAIGPKVTPPGGEGGTPAASNGTGLASTGFAGTTIAIVAGIIVIAGVAFLVVARIRRKRA